MKGGIILSQEQQLRFSVEESVWFQKGQEVSELLSISLDPDISIHEHDQYISIRGALLLTGEYKIDQDGSEGDSFEYANVRYVNEVETREDGISELSHRFPVDITIPRNRISQLDDVYVSIESFDYELPELKCLKLIADLSISGISDSEAVQNEEVETTREEELEPLYRESQDETEVIGEESFAQAERTAVSPFSSFYDVSESDDSDMDKLSPPSITIQKEVTESREESEEETLTEISSQDLSAQVEEPVEIEPEETEQQEVLNSEPAQDEEKEQEDLYDPFAVEVRKEEQNEEPQEVQYSFFSKSEAEVEEVEELQDQDERDEKDQKDAHYLTSLFARDDEEDFSRLKMCIVQQGDTLNSICDRYEISIQQIVRVNDFQADQDVYEGQILYIPAYSTSK